MTEHLQMVEDCEDRSAKLTDWETRFIASLSEQLGNDRRLTEKQSDRLEDIWEKVTANG